MSSDIDEFDDTSTFENKAGLAEDMRFLASIPEVKIRFNNILHAFTKGLYVIQLGVGDISMKNYRKPINRYF